MPWIKDSNDEDKYIASQYSRNELPTWNEVYNDWYCKYDAISRYEYYAELDPEIDPYWKIPRKLYLLATICNQFNKMIYEDKIIKENIRFALYQPSRENNCIEIPTIYTFKNPSKIDDPFVSLSNHCIIDENTDAKIMIYNGDELYDDYNIIDDYVSNTFINQFKEYFENGIGWKDENGNRIDNDEVKWTRAEDSAL